MKNLEENFNIDFYSQEIIEAIPYFVALLDLDGNVNHVTKNGIKSLKVEELKNIKNIRETFNYVDLFLSDSKKKIEVEEYPPLRVLEEGKSFSNIKFIVIDKTTKEKINHVELSTFPIVKENKTRGAIIIIKNITEEVEKSEKLNKEKKKLIELSTELHFKCELIEKLRKREKELLLNLQDVVDNISEGIVALDSNNNILIYNHAMSKILEINEKEQGFIKDISKLYIKRIDEESYHNFKDFILYNKNLTVKNEIFKINNSEENMNKFIELTYTPIYKANKKLVKNILVIKDITELIKSKIEAEEQASFIRNVVDNLDFPMVVVEYPSIRTKLINNKFKSLCIEQQEKNTLTGDEIKDYLNFLNNDHKDIRESFKTVAEKQIGYTISPYKIKDINGEDRFYKIKMIPYKYGGDSTLVHINGFDITDEINHSNELENINKLKDEFFTIMSHELRTPLTIIYSALQLANSVYSKEITPNIEKTLLRVNQNCSRLLKLINNILDISKAEAGFLNLYNQKFDLVYNTENIVNSSNSFAATKNIQLIFDTNEEDCCIFLDKDKYERIVLNLLSNSIKYTSENKNIYVSLKIEKEYFYLIVEDEGVGIPEDKINNIFDRFSRVNNVLSRRAEGTGLGLSLVKKLVDLMDGKITVKSKLGEGSKFIVRFKKNDALEDEAIDYSILNDSLKDKLNIQFSDIY